VVLRIEDAELKLRREVYLSWQELSLLLEEPAVAGLFPVESRRNNKDCEGLG
jgi:hypothetical protein